MFDIGTWIDALAALAAFAVAGWLVSLRIKDVSIVDSMWSLMFLLAAAIYAVSLDGGVRETLVLALTVLWSLRLAIYITARNWGEGEDYRYQRIRSNNSPNFKFKSIYIVFGLQAALAWIISLPLLASMNSMNPLSLVDLLGLSVWSVGLVFEAVGDFQLSRFKANPANAGKVFDKGLWRLTRHPNYFGNFCIWWGFYLFAVAAGGWWSIISPLLMSFLLLKVSGVAMLERDIGDRRPAYAHYKQTTNAFFPGPRREASA